MYFSSRPRSDLLLWYMRLAVTLHNRKALCSLPNNLAAQHCVAQARDKAWPWVVLPQWHWCQRAASLSLFSVDHSVKTPQQSNNVDNPAKFTGLPRMVVFPTPCRIAPIHESRVLVAKRLKSQPTSQGQVRWRKATMQCLPAQTEEMPLARSFGPWWLQGDPLRRRSIASHGAGKGAVCGRQGASQVTCGSRHLAHTLPRPAPGLLAGPPRRGAMRISATGYAQGWGSQRRGSIPASQRPRPRGLIYHGCRGQSWISIHSCSGTGQTL